MQKFKNYKKIIFSVGLMCLFLSGNAYAQSVGEQKQFFIENSFDVLGRSKIESVLVRVSPNLYFYIEKSWWDAQYQLRKDEILKNIDDLSVEFQNNIYPKLTSVFGLERRPGIDGDQKITILFHPIKGSEAGYFREADGYEKIQVTSSNEKEMVYISAEMLTSPKLKIVLGHEFTHLITFNQKNVSFRAEEEVWLNEARAEYSSTILGYDSQFDSSNLRSRMRDFIESSSDSITEWNGTRYDYASITLFINYLVDHFGVSILSDSLRSEYSGIASINYALEKSRRKERFAEIFTDWTIASVLNDCSVGQRYCYLNKDLSSLKVVPNVNFLPVYGNVSMSVINVVKNWAGTWQKFVEGNGNLKLEFSTLSELTFAIPYVLEGKNGKYSVNFLNLDNNKKGTINVPKFGADYKSLIIIPSLQNKTSGFEGADLAYPFGYSVTIVSDLQDKDQVLIQQILERIEFLKKQIAIILEQRGLTSPQSCLQMNNNLYFGLTNNSEVKCLQEFLKNQGAGIYPEGLVTGNFASLTQGAVIRFQEKYASEILTPLGLSSGTGYVGPLTRAKINQILSAK